MGVRRRTPAEIRRILEVIGIRGYVFAHELKLFVQAFGFEQLDELDRPVYVRVNLFDVVGMKRDLMRGVPIRFGYSGKPLYSGVNNARSINEQQSGQRNDAPTPAYPVN